MIFSHFDSIGPYFLSSAFIPLLFASKVRAKYNNDNIQPQIINTSSMNGWTKVSSFLASRLADLGELIRIFACVSASLLCRIPQQEDIATLTCSRKQLSLT